MFPVDVLYAGLRCNPDGIAVEDGERRLTYRELVSQVEAVAARLQQLAPAPQSRIGICAHNNLEHFIALFAVFAAGHVWVPLNPRNTRSELDNIAGHTTPSVLIIDEDCADKVTVPSGVARLIGAGSHSENTPETIRSAASANRGRRPQWPDLGREDLYAIKTTGGTTGRPKAVMQPYRAIMTCFSDMLATFNFKTDDCHLCVAPITHGAGAFILPIMARGGRHVLQRQSNAGAILEGFSRTGVTTVFLPPTVIYGLITEVARTPSSFPKLRHMIYGAAPMAPEKIQQARDVFGNVIEVIYGQAEAPMMITAMAAEEFGRADRLTSVGRACPLGRVEVMDAEGTIVPQGEFGEIVVRSDLVMKGYWQMPDETAATIVNGWLHTGDAGEFDEEGYLHIRDRLRDVIITGGFNVYPSDVEAVLLKHDGVQDCVVFGVADEKWGERVEAAVQLKYGSRIASAEALISFVKDHVGSVKAPKQIHVFAELPKSSVGKVLRREVKATLDRTRRQ